MIAGFGSYCAYRFANKYLGNGLVWTIFDPAHCDLLARSDSRLLHPDPCCSNEEDKRTVISIDEFDDDKESVCSTRRRSIKIKGPNGTFIKLIENPSKRLQLEDEGSKKGLAGLTPVRQAARRRSEILDEVSSVGGSSSFSAASRLRRTGKLQERNEEEEDAVSLAPTEASEIRLIWDGEVTWDDEFADDLEIGGSNDPLLERKFHISISPLNRISNKHSYFCIKLLIS